jgi:hypothetical protein
MLNRRNLIAALPAVLAATPACAAPTRSLTVYKTSSCGCCGGWITTMAGAGFRPKVVNQDDISPIWRRHGVPDELSSCHVAEIDGYITVGHVPPADVERLLRERPRAIGITVPGMPWGSPGMERPDGRKERYETLLLLPGGRSQVFARHG